MNLYDLKQNIKSMNPEQLASLLRDVRQSRRTSKKPMTAKKALERADTSKVLSAVASLSAEDKAALLADLLAQK
jgi:hypothetical protein